MTEKSSLPGSIQRERQLVEAAYVERLRKPFQSRSAEDWIEPAGAGQIGKR